MDFKIYARLNDQMLIGSCIVRINWLCARKKACMQTFQFFLPVNPHLSTANCHLSPKHLFQYIACPRNRVFPDLHLFLCHLQKDTR
jgi:hypothetical protein